MIELQYPGLMLKEDFIGDLNIDLKSLAQSVGVNTSVIEAIIEEEASISEKLSAKLGCFFGLSDTFWLKVQRDYDARISSDLFSNF